MAEALTKFQNIDVTPEGLQASQAMTRQTQSPIDSQLSPASKTCSSHVNSPKVARASTFHQAKRAIKAQVRTNQNDTMLVNDLKDKMTLFMGMDSVQLH